MLIKISVPKIVYPVKILWNYRVNCDHLQSKSEKSCQVPFDNQKVRSKIKLMFDRDRHCSRNWFINPLHNVSFDSYFCLKVLAFISEASWFLFPKSLVNHIQHCPKNIYRPCETVLSQFRSYTQLFKDSLKSDDLAESEVKDDTIEILKIDPIAGALGEGVFLHDLSIIYVCTSLYLSKLVFGSPDLSLILMNKKKKFKHGALSNPGLRTLLI